MGAVSEAAAEGTRRELLEAMRDRIAVAVDSPETPPRDLAALTRRLMDVAETLAALDAQEAEDDIGSALTIEDEDFDPETD